MNDNYSEIKKRLKKLVENRNYYFKDTFRYDAKKYLDKRRIFIGMEEDEIVLIEIALSYEFPEDFKSYLREFGKNCGELFCLGKDLNPKELVAYQKWGKELLKLNGNLGFLNKKTIFFEFHQGYTFSCFHTDESGEIKIYQYQEGDEKPVKRFENFKSMLEFEVEKLENIQKKLGKLNGYFIIIENGNIVHDYPSKNSGLNPKKIGDRFIDE